MGVMNSVNAARAARRGLIAWMIENSRCSRRRRWGDTCGMREGLGVIASGSLSLKLPMSYQCRTHVEPDHD